MPMVSFFFFFFFFFGPGPKVPRRTPRPDAPPVSFGPPQPTNLRNNKFTRKKQWITKQTDDNGPYSPKGKKWRPRAPGGIMPR